MPPSPEDLARDLTIDFVGGAVGHRHRFGGGRGQDLPRAAGFAKGFTPTIVDATAGLGRDAFLLASLGAEVTLIERSPHVHARLAEAIAAARQADPATAQAAGRMTLLLGDARELLPTLSPDVVTVDPMHPERSSSALVKKDMRTLRDLVGTDPDQAELMNAALACARRRVVLKWPRKAPPMSGLPSPSHQIVGKTLRYDVFMTPRT
ncbi:class I SAM-dependent methyltransferase [Phenylobacterium sp.]|uniref:class I SAM-dependent methyltransferase n=1 Tax=Phenylobacterium sp. TaxID=1871053 RepID=UPI0035B2FB3A